MASLTIRGISHGLQCEGATKPVCLAEAMLRVVSRV